MLVNQEVAAVVQLQEACLKACRFEAFLNLKSPVKPGFLVCTKRVDELLYFCFLVGDMFAYNRIVFFHFKLVRRGALVLGGGIEMAGTGAGHEFDFVTHDRSP